MDGFRRGPLRFRFTDSGPRSGDPVVLLHGFPQNAAAWAPVAARLSAAGHRVLALDQRGYSPGARPAGYGGYRLDDLVGDVLALLEATGSGKAHLVGHDWGGVVGWALADRHPEVLRSLVAVSTPHPRAFARSLLGPQALQSAYMLLLLAPRLPERLLAEDHGRIVRRILVRTGLDEPTATKYAGLLAEDADLASGALNWYRAALLDAPRMARTGPTGVPVMYVVGGRDTFVTPRAVSHTGDWVRSSYRLERIEDATHWIPEQQPGRCADAVLSFLASIG